MTFLSPAQRTELETIFGSARVSTAEDDLKNYGKDWTTYYTIKASAVVFPESSEEIQKLVRWARKNQIGLVPSGGRTGLSGGACALQGEVVVSFARMQKVLSFSPEESSVTVEAGMITETLQNWAKSKGLFYPVDFAARGSSHIGGNVATNAGGIKVLRYGLTRDWVMGLKAVTGAGEILSLNNSLVKNATGYDLRHLFIGSEGTLGFITEVTLRLAPPPPPLKVLLMATPSLAAVMQVFASLKKSVNLTAFEMFSDLALKHVLASTGLTSPLASPSPYYVLAEFEAGLELAEEQALECFSKLSDEGFVSDGALAQSEAQAKNFWRLREDISESLSKFSPYKNDLSVRISQVPALVADLDPLLKKAYPNWEVVWFGHIGDGNLHINILRPTNLTKEQFVQECRQVDDVVFAAVARQNGSISAEHGVGLSKKSFLKYSRSPEEIEILWQIKKIFDPDGIINPGKLLP